MAKCTCPLDAHALSQLCESCVGEYLNVCAQAELEDRAARETQATAGELDALIEQAIEVEDKRPATWGHVSSLRSEVCEIFETVHHTLELQDQRIAKLERNFAQLARTIGYMLITQDAQQARDGRRAA